MKDLVNIQDYLVSAQDVGDWEGDEEIVADKLNELLHYCWDLIPEDMDVSSIDKALNGIWDNLRGDTVLLDVEMDQLQDWVDTHIRSLLQSEQ
jgi:hypothetical protein